MSALHNIHRKPWWNEAMDLDELLEKLTSIKAGLGGRKCKVIGVKNPHSPQEAEVVAIQVRTELLDEEHGKHLNALAAEVTDIELEESSEDVKAQAAQGEVVYIVLGPPISPAPLECYER